MSIIFASVESLFTSSFKEVCLSEAKPANFYLQIFCRANFSKFWPENCFDFFDEKFRKSFDRQRLGHIGDFCFDEKLEQKQLQAITRHHNQQKFEQRASKFLIFWQLFFMRKFLLKLDQLMWESPFFGFLLRSRFLFRCRNETKRKSFIRPEAAAAAAAAAFFTGCLKIEEKTNQNSFKDKENKICFCALT